MFLVRNPFERRKTVCSWKIPLYVPVCYHSNEQSEHANLHSRCVLQRFHSATLGDTGQIRAPDLRLQLGWLWAERQCKEPLSPWFLPVNLPCVIVVFLPAGLLLLVDGHLQNKVSSIFKMIRWLTIATMWHFWIVLQGWRDPREVWRGCCPLSVLPATHNWPAGGNWCPLCWHHPPHQLLWRPSGWEVHLWCQVSVQCYHTDRKPSSKLTSGMNSSVCLLTRVFSPGW